MVYIHTVNLRYLIQSITLMELVPFENTYIFSPNRITGKMKQIVFIKFLLFTVIYANVEKRMVEITFNEITELQ